MQQVLFASCRAAEHFHGPDTYNSTTESVYGVVLPVAANTYLQLVEAFTEGSSTNNVQDSTFLGSVFMHFESFQLRVIQTFQDLQPFKLVLEPKSQPDEQVLFRGARKRQLSMNETFNLQ
ncbi:hypothetical protein Q8A73_002773 [Channa argus]|nr:hypothetical protein Q8A73_002773 [Channa argus]